MAYRPINFISSGFGNPVNYHVPGPMGNQFASPYGDPYRIDGVGDLIGSIVGGVTTVLGGIGKIATPLLPGLVQVGAGLLLNKTPQQQQQQTSTTQQTSQSQFTQASNDAQAQQVAAAAEKSNMVIYVAAGAVALFVAYYFISKRRR
jgi:hypothetical protein